MWKKLVHVVAGGSPDQRLLWLRCCVVVFWGVLTVAMTVVVGIMSCRVVAVIKRLQENEMDWKRFAIFAISGGVVILSCVYGASCLSCPSTQSSSVKSEFTSASTDVADVISVMSINLRGAGLDGPGLNSWDTRKKGIARMIQGEAPLIVGTQEGSPPMLQYLEHSSAGKYRRFDKIKDFSTLYDSSRAEVLEGERFAISIPGSHFPKHCSYALFRLLEEPPLADSAANVDFNARTSTSRMEDNSKLGAVSSNNKYVMHFNVHTDFVDEAVRQEQVRVLHRTIAAKVSAAVNSPSNLMSPSNCIVVITGDFNSLRFGPSWHELVTSGASFDGIDDDSANTHYLHYEDTALAARVKHNKSFFSFHGFLGSRIESYFYAFPLSLVFTLLHLATAVSSSVAPSLFGLNSMMRAPMSMDFHVDWILVGSIRKSKSSGDYEISSAEMEGSENQFPQCESNSNNRANNKECNGEDGGGSVSIHSHKTLSDSSSYFDMALVAAGVSLSDHHPILAQFSLYE